MKFKNLSASKSKRMKKIFAKVPSSINCLSVSRSSNANRQMQSHLRFLHQIRLKSMLSTVSSAGSSSNRRPWLNIFATMQTDITAEHEGSSEINPTKCDWS